MDIKKISDTLWEVTYTLFDLSSSNWLDKDTKIRINPQEVYYMDPHNKDGQILYYSNSDYTSGIFDMAPCDVVILAHEIISSFENLLISIEPPFLSEDYFEKFWINISKITWFIEGKVYLPNEVYTQHKVKCLYVHFGHFQYKVFDMMHAKYIKYYVNDYHINSLKNEINKSNN